MLLESLHVFSYLFLTSGVFHPGRIQNVNGKGGAKFPQPCSGENWWKVLCMLCPSSEICSGFGSKYENLGFLIWQQNLLLLGVIYSSNTHQGLLTKHCAMGQEHLWPHRPDISGRQSQNTVFTCDSAKCQDEKSRRPRELLTEDQTHVGSLENQKTTGAGDKERGGPSPQEVGDTGNIVLCWALKKILWEECGLLS